jgi:hypothetical protein
VGSGEWLVLMRRFELLYYVATLLRGSSVLLLASSNISRCPQVGLMTVLL